VILTTSYLILYITLKMYGIYSCNDTLSNLRIPEPPNFACAT
jgi:hypothetical protein